MTAMFAADQAARQRPDIDWSSVAAQDTERRTRTRSLLAAGKLESANDLYHAAFIFQHGGTADDYLLAHTLAVAAVAKGHTEAPWIAAATLDRFLQAIGRSQVYGTQFRSVPGQPVTQESFDRGLIDDRLRTLLGVPTLAAQDDRRRALEAERAAGR